MTRTLLDDLLQILGRLPASANVRIFGNAALAKWLRDGAIADVVGPKTEPVRAILFDKTAESNWALGWHQDRTIAVRERVEHAGFERWTVKSGVAHVEPPFSIIERMLTIRIHLDPVTATNAPLLVAPGSHRLGRIRESEIDATVERCGTVACLADRGDVWLYRTAILHASAKSRSAAGRRVLQVDFSSEDLPGPWEWLGIA